MSVFPRLWQRIFVCCLLAVLVSQGIMITVFQYFGRTYVASSFLGEISQNTAASMEGQDLASIQTFISFSSRDSKGIWLEGTGESKGQILAGTPAPQFEKTRQSIKTTPYANTQVTLYTPENDSLPRFASIPVNLQNGPAILYISSFNHNPPPLGLARLPLFTIACLSGAGLSLWSARYISRPLQTLCKEVLCMAQGNLDTPVTKKGRDEVADVAGAVETLARNLSHTLTSMKELLGNISHELRSPLTRIHIDIALLEEKLARLSQTEIKEAAFVHITAMQKEMALMESLVEDTLQNSRLDLQREICLEPVAFSELCAEMLRRHITDLNKTSIHLEAYISPDIWIQGEEMLLCRMVENLLENAIKYTEPHGQLVIRLTRSHNTVTLRMENSCKPVPEERLPRLFEPFYRGDVPTGNGVGLGLALVEKIARIHHGTIHAENGTIGLAFVVEIEGE